MPIKSLKSAGVKALGQGIGSKEEVDSHFNETILLLHADGSEGKGNTSNLGDPNYKAFRDNSTSAHVITIGGGAYGNDFSPYYYANGYWSNFFDGGTDHLQIASSSDFVLGTNNFTIEFWVNFLDNASSTFYCIENNGALFFYDGAKFVLGKRGSSTTYLTYTVTPTLNAWHHVALCRDGTGTNQTCLFYNGTRVAQATVSNNFSNQNVLQIGNIGGLGGYDLHGYLSNYRVVNGSSVYSTSSSSITVPTTPLTAVTNTKLLTCQSNRFVDNSSTGHTISLSGTPKVSANTPFAVTKTANVGSGFFDGNADVIYATETGSEFTYGTGDFEFSCWVYRTVNNAQQTLFGRNSTGNTLVPYIYITSGNILSVYYSGGVVSGSVAVPVNAWCHLVASRVSGTLKLFQDGVEVGSVSDSNNLIASGKVAIGNQWSGGTTNAFTGYIADARVRKGYGVTSVTRPTTTVTAETGTELLTCQYSGAVRNVGFVDDSKYNNLIVANGGASLGTFSPFSLEDTYWSVYFNSSHFNIPDSSDFTFGSNNFSIAVWVYRTGSNASTEVSIANTGGNSYTSWLFTTKKFWGTTTGGAWNIQVNYSQDVPVHQWVYVQVNRVGNVYTVYQNGVSVGTTTVSGSLYNNSDNFQLGFRNGAGNMLGYMSNFIMTNGGNLANTNVPTSPATADSNTKLLCLQSNRFIDNSSSGHTLSPDNSNVKVKPFSPFAPSRSYSKDVVGGSAFFDQGKISFNPRAFDAIRNGDFTIEFWWYPVGGLTGYPGLFSMGIGGGYGNIINIGVTSNNALTGSLVSGYSADFTTPHNSYRDFQWHHIVLTRSGSGSNNCAFYINGVRINQFTDTGDIGTGANVAYLGSQWYSSSRYGGGYYSSFRATNNAVYDITSATLTVPSAPLSDTANTLALTKFDNAGIIDHTMKNILLGVGDTRITTTDKKIGTGSLVFDGTDYLQAVNTEPRELFTPNGGDMTWEMFVKFDILDGLHTLFSKYGSGSEYQFYYDNNSTDWRFVYHSSVYTWDDNSITTGTWYHIALVKDGQTHYLFKNGTSLGTNTATETSLTGRNFALGCSFNGNNSALYHLKGKLDEVRVTKVARYTSSFQIPTKSYPNK